MRKVRPETARGATTCQRRASAREEATEEFAEGYAPGGVVEGSVAPDDAAKEWLPDHLRERRPESAGV